MSKRKANVSAPQSPASKAGKRKVARQEASATYVSSGEDDYPTPNTSNEVRAKDIPNRREKVVENSGRQLRGRPSAPQNANPNKGKQRAQEETDDEDDVSQYEGDTEEDPSPAPSASPTPSPGPRRRKTQATVSKPSASKPSTSKTPKKGTKKATKGKIENKFGTKKQGLHFVVFGGRSNLDSMAEFEKLCTIRAHSERAVYNAKAKAHDKELRSKEFDLKIQEVNLKRLERMPAEAILLEFKAQLADKDEQIVRLQEKLARTDIEKMGVEIELEKEKTGRIKAEHESMAVQEKFLREQRAAEMD